MLMRGDASSENYGPRVYFNHIAKTLFTLLQFIYFYFTLQFIYLQLSDLILAINEYKGIDNPLARVGCKYLLLCVCRCVDGCLHESPTGFDNLVLTEGNTYPLLYCISLPL